MEMKMKAFVGDGKKSWTPPHHRRVVALSRMSCFAKFLISSNALGWRRDNDTDMVLSVPKSSVIMCSTGGVQGSGRSFGVFDTITF